MIALVRISGTAEQWQRLCRKTERYCRGAPINMFSGLAPFIAALSAQPPCAQVAICLLAHRDDLLELISIKEWFTRLHLILLIPDMQSETLTLAHRLGPRFIECVDGDLDAVAAVARRMTARLVAWGKTDGMLEYAD